MLAALALLALVASGCGKTAPKKKPSTSKKVKDLIYQLGNKEKKVRKKAEDGLVKIGKPAVKPLIAALKGDSATRTVGVGLLGTTKGAAVTMLKGDESIRAYAARALGRIGDEGAIDPLIEALKDEDAQKPAAEALKKITKQDFGTDAAKWEAWREAQGAEEKKG
jgi:HEAT repeat protein